MILVLEDNKALRVLIKKSLEKEGFEVELSKNGKEGLEIMKDVVPDLIISDVMMPEMDGFEFLDKVRKDYPTLPVIMLTIKSELDDYRRGYELGATEYITKPFEMETLIKKVKKRINSADSIEKFVYGDTEMLSAEEVSPVDILSYLRDRGIDSKVKISGSQGSGWIEIKKGEIKEGKFNELEGKKAISRIATLKEGNITLKKK